MQMFYKRVDVWTNQSMGIHFLPRRHGQVSRDLRTAAQPDVEKETRRRRGGNKQNDKGLPLWRCHQGTIGDACRGGAVPTNHLHKRGWAKRGRAGG